MMKDFRKSGDLKWIGGGNGHYAVNLVQRKRRPRKAKKESKPKCSPWYDVKNGLFFSAWHQMK